jgi:hypothetical protein
MAPEDGVEDGWSETKPIQAHASIKRLVAKIHDATSGAFVAYTKHYQCW